MGGPALRCAGRRATQRSKPGAAAAEQTSPAGKMDPVEHVPAPGIIDLPDISEAKATEPNSTKSWKPWTLPFSLSA